MSNSFFTNNQQIGDDINGSSTSEFTGFSVSLSEDGTILATGVPSYSSNGQTSGKVRVYQNTHNNWIQLGQDIVGETIGDEFGGSVSLSSNGTVIAVGAPDNDGNGPASGHVRIYQYVNGTWTQLGQDIDGEASDDQSGISVSLSSDGSIVAIGAYGNESNKGHVRIYQNSNGTWTQLGQDIDGEASNDQSGTSVSLSSDGTIVAIGAPRNDGNSSASGHVRIYQYSSGTWTQLGQDIDGEGFLNFSGYSVSLSSDGTIVAIGSPLALDQAGNGRSGQVQIYQYTNNNWIQLGQDIHGESSGDHSGESVSISADGSVVAIGAPYNDGNGNRSGHVRIYQYSNNNWIQVGQDFDGEDSNDDSGAAVSISADGSTVAIGAISNDGNGGSGTRQGHVRVFRTGVTQNLILTSATSVSVLNGYDLQKSGIITATVTETDVATLKTLTDTNGNNAYSITISDSTVSALDLLTIDGITSVAINASSISTITGAATDIKNVYASSGITGLDNAAINVSGSTASVSDLNILDGETTGVITATVTETDVATLKNLANANSNNAYTINVSGSTAAATDLNILDSKTTVAIDASSISTITGAAADVKTVYESTGITTATTSTTWQQIGSNIDAPSGDRAGYSLALSNDGTVVAIGSPYNDDNGQDSGQVRIFKNNNGTFTQIGSDIHGETAGDRLAYKNNIALSNDGSIVVIGAPYNDGNGNESGHARVYENNNGTWTQIGNDIDAEASGDQFGSSTAISSDGSIIAIGANLNDGGGFRSGHVRVYENNSGSWTQVGNDIDGEAVDDRSGNSISLSTDGTIIAIGAPRNDGNGNNSGHVRVYKNNNGSWTQIGNDIDGEASGDFFGRDVDLSSDGTILAVGGFLNDGNGNDSGHVRVYKNNNGSWTQIGNDIDGEASDDWSGWSVKLSDDGTVVSIGSIYSSVSQYRGGQARIFKYENETWTKIGNDINGGSSNGNLGRSIGLSGDGTIVALGASGAGIGGQVSLLKGPGIIPPSQSVTMSDSTVAADLLNTVDTKTSGSIALSNATKIRGTISEINTAYTSSGITGLANSDGSGIKINNTFGKSLLNSQFNPYQIIKTVKNINSNQYELLVEGKGAYSDKFSVWSTNTTGSITGKTKWLSGTEMTAGGYNTVFDRTFTDPTSSAQIADSNNDGLVDNTNKYQIYDGGSAITVETASGKSFLTSETGIFSITKAVKDTSDNTYDLLAEGVGVYSDKFSVWSTNTTGSITGKTKWLSGTEMTAGGYNTVFDRTFTDPVISNINPVADSNNDGLVDNTNKYQIYDGGSAITVETASGKSFLTANTDLYTITKAVLDADNSKYDLLLEGVGGISDKYAVWSTNTMGTINGKTSWLTGSEMQSSGYETTFSVDFNSNGSIV